MEYGRIISGATSAMMAMEEWRLFVELVAADECPAGFLPVEKVLPKPTPGPGETLCFTYTRNGDTLRKEYFTAPRGTRYLRRWSRRSIMKTLQAEGLWADVKALLQDGDGYAWDEFALSDYVENTNDTFLAVYETACRRYGKDAVDAILAKIPAED